ncbi:MAG: serine--tRNA ligase [archaeon]
MPKIKDLASRKEEYLKVLENRGLSSLVPVFEKGLEIYSNWKKINFEVQKLREKLNKLSLEYAKEKDPKLLEESKKVKNEIQRSEEKLAQYDEELEEINILLPNWLSEMVPVGVGDEFEKPIEYMGKPKVWVEFKDEFEKKYPGVEAEFVIEQPFHHYNLVGTLIDQEKAGEVAGARFYYLFNDLVILDLALNLYTLEFFKKKGYGDVVLIPPYFMRKDVEKKITHLSTFEESIFELEKEGLILIPSSEHPIMAYFEDTIFKEEELPLRILAWSPCFRKEAGAHGKDTKGIFRVKQFLKTEIQCMVRKEEDFKEVEKVRKDVQEFVSSLELPNRSVIVPSGDMDKRAVLQVDVQTWFPGQNAYRETHSIATMDTWVSEKLKIRYKTKTWEKEFVRNIYSTGVASERIICAIAENLFDPSTKNIRVPKVLHKYMDKEYLEITSKHP